MRVKMNADGIADLPFADLVRIYGQCPHCKTDTVFVAFNSREFWEHSETEHPETITRKGR